VLRNYLDDIISISTSSITCGSDIDLETITKVLVMQLSAIALINKEERNDIATAVLQGLQSEVLSIHCN
jgi:hypothetical protein